MLTENCPTPSLETLLNTQKHLWRGAEPTAQLGFDTGYEMLNQALPQQGWPLGGVVECFVEHLSQGLSLWLPTMARLTQAGQWVVLLCPPLLPYAPALKQQGVNLDNLQVIEGAKYADWVAEKLARLQSCGLLLAWFDQMSWAQIRRLQLAVSEGGGLMGVFLTQYYEPSPAALRLGVSIQTPQSLRIDIKKAKGQSQKDPVYLPLP